MINKKRQTAPIGQSTDKTMIRFFFEDDEDDAVDELSGTPDDDTV